MDVKFVNKKRQDICVIEQYGIYSSTQVGLSDNGGIKEAS